MSESGGGYNTRHMWDYEASEGEPETSEAGEPDSGDSSERSAPTDTSELTEPSDDEPAAGAPRRPRAEPDPDDAADVAPRPRKLRRAAVTWGVAVVLLNGETRLYAIPEQPRDTDFLTLQNANGAAWPHPFALAARGLLGLGADRQARRVACYLTAAFPETAVRAFLIDLTRHAAVASDESDASDAESDDYSVPALFDAEAEDAAGENHTA